MIQTNIQELQSYLKELEQRGHNLRPVMGIIGEKIHTATMEAFEKQKDPISGRPWSPVSSTTLFAQTGGKKRSKVKSGKAHTKSFLRKASSKMILHKEGDLKKSIDYEATKDSIEWFASKEYAATHQFGDEKRNIVQRRYMPFTDKLDLPNKLKEEILEDIRDYIIGK